MRIGIVEELDLARGKQLPQGALVLAGQRRDAIEALAKQGRDGVRQRVPGHCRVGGIEDDRQRIAPRRDARVGLQQLEITRPAGGEGIARRVQSGVEPVAQLREGGFPAVGAVERPLFAAAQLGLNALRRGR